MERFVELIVAGGAVLVAGLWIATLAETGSLPWIAGVALALLGTAANVAGIVRELEPGAFEV